MPARHFSTIMLAVGFLLAPLTATAATDTPSGPTQPLWELGAGVGLLATPAYLGSRVTRRYAVPWPYAVYRGEFLRANREGVGLQLKETPRTELDLSFSGTLPVDSADTERAGMHDLPLAVESGTVYAIALARSPVQQLSLRLPLRYATGVDHRYLMGIGWISDPTLRWTRQFQIGGQAVEWGLDLAVKFQDRRYNNFYYRVREREATDQRPAYQARGGYAGSTLNTGVLLRRGAWVGGAFVGVSLLNGARFADSPLVSQHANWFGGLALTWVFEQSDTRVARPAPL